MGAPRSAKGRARETQVRLAEEYPGSAVELCELDHHNPFELLAATILSAQSTDKMVNSVTPILFSRWPTPEDLANADPSALEEVIHSTGFFRAKARSLIGMAQGVVERYDGSVPGPIEDLVTLPGVGRKTANVIRSVAMDLPGLPVDTHVLRLSKLLGLTTETDPVKVEHDLGAMIPAAGRGTFSLRMILHGRRVCVARRPACDRCPLADFCPSAFVASRAPVAKAPRGAAKTTAKISKNDATTVSKKGAAKVSTTGAAKVSTKGTRTAD